MAASYGVSMSLTAFTVLGLVAFAIILLLGNQMGMDQTSIIASSMTILAVTLIVPLVSMMLLN